MPKIPLYDNLQADIAAAPNERVTPTVFQQAPAFQPAAFQAGQFQAGQVQAAPMQTTPGTNVQELTSDQATIGSRQLEGLGRAELGTGATIEKMVVDAQQQANRLREDDSLNQLHERAATLTYDKDVGYQNQRGISALFRPSGQPLSNEYVGKLQDAFKEISDNLGNDAQREGFAIRANNLIANFHAGVMHHEADQGRAYGISVQQGTIKNAVNDIGLNPTSIQAIDENLATIQSATLEMARLNGGSSKEAEADARKMTSNALTFAIGSAIDQKNIGFAIKLMSDPKYSKQMDVDDLLKVRNVIVKESNNTIGTSIGVSIAQQAASTLTTSDGDRAFNLLIKPESGGDHFGGAGSTARSDSPTTSKKGATGLTQIMPNTAPEAAKIAGLEWNPELFNRKKTGDPIADREARDYNYALGRAYFGKQLQDFGGNLAMAYAAYNGGAGRLKEAIYTAQLTGEPDKWLKYMPDETIGYVSKIMGDYNAGMGLNAPATLADVRRQVRSLIPNNPEAQEIALKKAEDEFEVNQKAIKQQEDAATANAMRGLVSNGGDFSSLAPGLRTSIPVADMEKVMNFGKRISKGDDVDNPAVYQDLTSNRNKLLAMTDDQFFKYRAELSESTWQSFARERGDYKSGKVGMTADDINSEAMMQTLKTGLNQLKIDPTPKEGTSAAAQVGTITKVVRDQLIAAQRQAGKKFSEVETIEYVNSMFAKNYQLRSSISTMFDSSKQVLGMNTGDIPSDIRKAIKSDLLKKGVKNPLDAQIQEAFYKAVFAKKD